MIIDILSKIFYAFTISNGKQTIFVEFNEQTCVQELKFSSTKSFRYPQWKFLIKKEWKMFLFVKITRAI